MVDVNQFKLIIEDDEGRRSVVPVELGEVSIGRLEGNTIRLKERNVSRHHARLLKDGNGIFAEDLDSYNGLWVNGDRVQGRHELHDGDLIRIGDFHLELRGEGLHPRREDTTQRTLLGDSDTQPGFHSGGHLDEPTLTGANPVSAEPTQIIDQAGPLGGDESFAHTAIIRPNEESTAAAAPDRRGPPPNVLTGQRPRLICVSTQYAGREYEIIKSETIIGRADDNDIGVDHRSVSRQHAKIVVTGRRYKIVDLESANGTLVNGEAYAQTDLKRGDLIELGHVKFRFVPPGETYALTLEEQAAVHGGGRTQRAGWVFMLWGAGGVLGILLLIAAWLALNGDKSDPELQPPLPGLSPPHGSDSSGGEADRLMTQVRVNIQQHQWKRAQTLAQAVLALDPAKEEALSAMRQIDLETRAQHSLEVASQSTGQNQWSDAWNALQEVPKESTLFPQAIDMMNKVRPTLIIERLNECRSAIKAEDWDEAEMELEEVEGLDSTRKEIAELRATIEEGRKHRSAASPDKHTKAAHAKLKEAPKVVKPLAPPPPPPPKPAAEDPKSLYSDGVKALLDSQYNKAIDDFNRCVQADKNYALCYRGLGIAYARIRNGPKAARYYRLYLKVDPKTPEADQVRQFLKQYESQQ